MGQTGDTSSGSYSKEGHSSGETLVINYRLPEVSNLAGNSADMCLGGTQIWPGHCLF
jgi:hypothetical protein